MKKYEPINKNFIEGLLSTRVWAALYNQYESKLGTKPYMRLNNAYKDKSNALTCPAMFRDLFTKDF